MKKKKLVLSIGMLLLFFLWTAACMLFDVKPIGPDSSHVGFATLNGDFHSITGVNMELYNITDILSVIPLGIVLGFGAIGFVQLIKRKHVLKVDRNILVLGVFFAAVMVFFIFFEVFVVNYRPVLIEGKLEASYPSSTTMLVTCVMPATLLQINDRIKSKILKRILSAAIILFAAFMVVGRILSGVHWISDIIGGALLSTSLVLAYAHFSIQRK